MEYKQNFFLLLLSNFSVNLSFCHSLKRTAVWKEKCKENVAHLKFQWFPMALTQTSVLIKQKTELIRLCTLSFHTMLLNRAASQKTWSKLCCENLHWKTGCFNTDCVAGFSMNNWSLAFKVEIIIFFIKKKNITELRIHSDHKTQL